MSDQGGQGTSVGDVARLVAHRQSYSDSGGYRQALAAVEAATGAAHMLMTAVRDGGPVDVDDVLTALCDAVAAVCRIEGREQDTQLHGAVEKWLSEVGVEVYGLR